MADHAKPIPDMPDDVWADVQAIAARFDKDPVSLLMEAWREYAFRRRVEGRLP